MWFENRLVKSNDCLEPDLLIYLLNCAFVILSDSQLLAFSNLYFEKECTPFCFCVFLMSSSNV